MDSRHASFAVLFCFVLGWTSLLSQGAAMAELQVVELDCHGAAPDGTSIHVEADLGGPAVMMAPWLPRDVEAGTLTPVEARGQLNRHGASITGTLAASIPRLGRDAKPAKNAKGDLAVELRIEATVADGVLTGRWQSGQAKGLVTGLQRELPDPRLCTTGALVMVTAYPADGRVLALGLGANAQQLGAAMTLADGVITGGRIQPGAVRGSYYPVKRYTPAQWVDAAGRTVHFCGDGLNANNPATGEPGDPFTDTTIAGGLQDGGLRVTVVSTFRGKQTTWRCAMRRAGAMWHGTWTWDSPGFPEASAVAVARLGQPASAPAQTRATSPRAVLLRHALALAAHPSAGGWHDDVLGQAMKGNGNKQYDNASNIVAAGIHLGLLMDRLSDDPVQRAEGMAIARRAANWSRLARFGQLRVGEYYKGMFWVTAWQGLAMADLARREPDGPWKTLAGELATMYREQQVASGAWTWVDEETGERGHSNERSDRSLDNRELNGGDILLAMARCSRASGMNSIEAQRKAESWLLNQFGREQLPYSNSKSEKQAQRGKPGDVLAFYQDRRPGTSKDCLPSVSFLLHLAEQDPLDAAAVEKVRAAIEREFAEDKGGLLTGYYPRAAPGDPGQSLDLAGSARYAHALALLASKGDAAAKARAQGLIDAILAKASATSGLIDHYGRDLPADPDALGKIDSHSYLCLKASLAWELADAIDLLTPSARPANP